MRNTSFDERVGRLYGLPIVAWCRLRGAAPADIAVWAGWTALAAKAAEAAVEWLWLSKPTSAAMGVVVLWFLGRPTVAMIQAMRCKRAAGTWLPLLPAEAAPLIALRSWFGALFPLMGVVAVVSAPSPQAQVVAAAGVAADVLWATACYAATTPGGRRRSIFAGLAGRFSTAASAVAPAR